MRPCFSNAVTAPAEERAALAPDAVNLRIAEQQVGDGFLRRRGVVGRVGLGQDLDARIGLEHGLRALAPIVADRDAGRAVQNEMLPLPLSCLTSHSAASLPHWLLVGVDLRRQLLGVDEAVEIGDRDPL